MNNIDILEELLSTQKQYIEDKDYQKEHNINEQAIDYAKRWAKAIENLISENKKLKEENQRLNVKIIDLYKYSIPKLKVEEILKKIENRNYNDYTGCQDGNEVKYNIIQDIKEFLGKE